MAKPITFIDLFCGIGGFRLGLEKVGAYKCVWANDWEYADYRWERNRKTGRLEWRGPRNLSGKVYTKHWNDGTYVDTDVKTVDTQTIPNHDLLCAGFPCQSFSVAGNREGFEDARGTLFFEIARLLQAKKPKSFLLENVRGLTFDRGIFARVIKILAELDYWVRWRILNSKNFGVPQNRERVFIVGFKEQKGFSFPLGVTMPIWLSDILEKEVDEKYFLSEKQTKWLKEKSQTDPQFRLKLVPDSTRVSSVIHSRYGAGWRSHGQEQLVTTEVDAHYGKGPDRHGQRSLIQVGEIWEGSQCRVYDPKGIAPTLHKSGGKTEPMILQKNQRNEVVGKEISGSIHRSMSNRQAPMVVADRTRTYANKGRSLESPKEVTNTLSGVQKDNLILTVGNIYPSGGEAGKVVDAEGIYPTVKQGKRGGKAGMPPIAIYDENIDGNVYRREETYPSLRTIQRPCPIRFLNRNQKNFDPNVAMTVDTAQSMGIAVYDIYNTRWRSNNQNVGTIRPNFTEGSRSGFALSDGVRIRRLTPTECERLQSFPDGWTEGVSDSQRYKLLGNAVTVSVIEAIGREMKKWLTE